MELTDRDIGLIRRVHALRLLGSRSHILPLYGSEHILRRCKLLTEEGHLYALKRMPHQEQVYAIGNRGADLLKERFGTYRPRVHFPDLHNRLKEPHIRHTLGIADVVIGMELASRGRCSFEDLGTHKWETDIEYDGWGEVCSIEPDRIFQVAGQYYALEYDRGTMRVKGNMRQSSIFKKMLQYAWTHNEKILQDTLGLTNVRTLFVLPGQGRLKTCIEANRYFDGGTGLFLFTTAKNLLERDPLTAPLLNGRSQTRTLL